MEILIIIISIIVFLYSLMILLLIVGFYKVQEVTYKGGVPINDFSIIIPFRNEEENLELLVDSLSKIEYPSDKFEVVFVNDHSDDDSLEVLYDVLKSVNFDFKVLSQIPEKNGKKYALTLGIENASYQWILTTDADCIVQPLWINLYDQELQETDLKMVAGPINFISTETGFLEAFQKLDLSSLIGTSIGSFGLGTPLVSNGANLLFSKTAFYDVLGYQGNMNIASGDDMFLMEKFKNNYPDKIKYLKAHDAIVYTDTVKDLSQFINQRLRWSAKSSAYGSVYIKLVGLVVGLANVSLIILYFLAIFGVSLNIVLSTIFIKLIVDFWLIAISSSFLKDTRQLLYYPIMAVVYPFYVLGIATVSQFKTFEWKGRRFQK